ncbi:MAG: hypothetical protein JO208_02175, partial [Alphaproteobacteria bacterium]|nr:hypothetical protein [Alphaproteobacteria bacterium]
LLRVAAQLKADLRRAPATIELEGYAPTPESRIIAVQRVVDVRLALVEAGVAAEHINVQVLPRAASDGAVDRVTIYLHREEK